MKEDEIKLNELDKLEWFDVCKKLVPELTDEDYDNMWNDFIQYKKDFEKKVREH